MIAVAREVSDPLGLYEKMATSDIGQSQLRRNIFSLSHMLASSARTFVRQEVGERATILCSVMLRGGILLYPGFGKEFTDADFCLLGMHRNVPDSVDCNYKTEPRHRRYDVAVLVDCVSASGGTLLAARNAIRETCDVSVQVAAVICSAKHGTDALTTGGVNVIGFSLAESLEYDNLVIPDLGREDAGDLFSGISRTSDTTA